MEAGHVIYKTDDLNKSVTDFRDMGFVVEYGKKKNPNNALIYFSQGAYLEILEKTGMPKLVKVIYKLKGEKKFVERMDSWDYGDNGLIGFCIEGTEKQLKKAKISMDGDGVSLSPTRKDTHGRTLEYDVFFPNDITCPFFMTHFSIEPRPKENIHPNGVTKISKIYYPLSKEKQKKISPLIDDNSIHFVDDLDEPIKIEFDKPDIKIK